MPHEVRMKVFGTEHQTVIDLDGRICPGCRGNDLLAASRRNAVVAVEVGDDLVPVHSDCAAEVVQTVLRESARQASQGIRPKVPSVIRGQLREPIFVPDGTTIVHVLGDLNPKRLSLIRLATASCAA